MMWASVMRGAIAAGFVAGVATGAMAGPHDAAIEAIAAEAAADWSTLLSCSILSPDDHATITRWWDEELADINALLAEAEVAPKTAALLLTRLDHAVLMAPTTGDAATLIAFCNSREDWRRRMALFTIAQPARDIERLLRP